MGSNFASNEFGLVSPTPPLFSHTKAPHTHTQRRGTTHTHTHTHTHARTHAHTHTRTHAQARDQTVIDATPATHLAHPARIHPVDPRK